MITSMLNKDQVLKYQKMFNRQIAAGKSQEFALEFVCNSVWNKAFESGKKAGVESVAEEERQRKLDEWW